MSRKELHREPPPADPPHTLVVRHDPGGVEREQPVGVRVVSERTSTTPKARPESRQVGRAVGEGMVEHECPSLVPEEWVEVEGAGIVIPLKAKGRPVLVEQTDPYEDRQISHTILYTSHTPPTQAAS